jgi:hypothetical protein
VARACATCGGMGFGCIGPTGYVDDGKPCVSCNPNGVPKGPGSFAPTADVKTGVDWVDGVGRSSPEDTGEGADAFFAPQQIAAQRAADAVQERAERERRAP